MADAAQHAKLSPSGAHRWMHCPGSLLAESFVPNKSSSYANEGTAAHELAAWTLESEHKNAEAFLGRQIKVENETFEVTQDMCNYIQEYVDEIVSESGDERIFVEVKVDFSDTVDVPESFGTADAVVLKGHELKVDDLKYGRGVQVSPVENEQAMIYALGALELYDVCDEVEEITIGIHMPRKNGSRYWTVSKAELLQFAEKLKTAAHKAIELYNLRTDPEADIEEILNREGVLIPGTKTCQWCNFKAQCPALGNKVLSAVTQGAAGLADMAADTKGTKVVIEHALQDVQEETEPTLMSGLMDVTTLIDSWVKAVRQHVADELEAGRGIPGYKLVKGKKGHRKWTDNKEAEAMLKSMRVRQADMYSFKLISPTQAEKVLKNSARKWKRANTIITQSEGNLTVAPESDPRPAEVVATQDDEFQPLTDDSCDLV